MEEEVKRGGFCKNTLGAVPFPLNETKSLAECSEQQGKVTHTF